MRLLRLIIPVASGGVGPYTYLWSNGQHSILVNVGPGVSANVGDANACELISNAYSITEPSSISLTLDSFSNVRCNGDSDGDVFINIAGGTPNYSFQWSNGQTTQNLNSISGGLYQLVVIDSNACEDSLSVSIYEPDPLIVQLDTLINESCVSKMMGFFLYLPWWECTLIVSMVEWTDIIHYKFFVSRNISIAYYGQFIMYHRIPFILTIHLQFRLTQV